MKLLVDARIGWGHGIGRVIANTVPRLARLRTDWRIDALIPPDQLALAQEAFAGPTNLHIVPCPVRAFSPGEQVQLTPYARHYDLTWFTNYWVPLRWSGPFAVTVHDMLHLMPELVPASRGQRALARLTFAKVRRDAHAVMFDSRFTEAEFNRLVGAPRKGVTVALGGDHLDYGALRPVTKRTRRLLVVAASKQHKNFALLFEAWARAQVAEHWVLTIISSDATLRNSVDVSAIAGQEGRIDIRSNLSNAELAALYADSAIVLMPSRYEGFGLPLLEGMLAGALCLCSNAGSMVEIAEGAFVQVVNGTDRVGWTGAIEEACATIDRDVPELEPLLRHNIERARRFRWDQTAQEIAAVLESVV